MSTMPVVITNRRRFFRRTIFALSPILLALPARAHARLVRSAPADQSRLPASPRRIDFWFNELLDREFNRVEVFPAAEATAKKRKNLVSARPELDPADRTHLFVKLGPLAPGDYIAEVQVLSRDGHTARSRISFSIHSA